MTASNSQLWRDHLNDAERAEIAILDQKIIDARNADADATRMREAIRRRATGRMRRLGKSATPK